jgi:hypothetical protein
VAKLGTKIASKVLLVASIIIVLGIAAFTRLPDRTPRAFACSIGMVTLEQAVKEADAAAVVEVVAVKGAENSAPLVTPVASSRPARPRRDPVELTGYGASMRLHEAVFGEVPPEFEVDAAARRRMEEAERLAEAFPDVVPPCPSDFAIARYVSRQYYLVLFEQGPAGLGTFYMFNYQIDFDVALIRNELDGEKQPWRLEMLRPVYERFFSSLSASRVYPPPEPPSGLAPVPRDEEIWQLDGPRVPLISLVEALRALRGQAIRPPVTGDGGLVR